MPGNVQNALPAEVMPDSLYTLFEQSRERAVRENVYANGESQRAARTTTSRKSWSASKRLTADELDELRGFLQDRRGIEAFYFYDGMETSPKWSFDPTGMDPTGRYTVRVAEASIAQATYLGSRAEISITLVEVT